MTPLTRLLPRRSDYSFTASSLRHDLVAGVTVGVVALPLALAFGIASGMGATAGLVTAIVAGITTAIFGGSNVQVSGPTGAMAVVLVPVVAQHGRAGVIVVGLMAGMILLSGALLRAGRLLSLVPWPVIEGFTVGIATLIFLQQVPHVLGVTSSSGSNTVATAVRAVIHPGSRVWDTLSVMAVVVVVMVVVPRIHRALPASILAVIAATVLDRAAHLGVATIGAIPSTLPAPSLPSFDLPTLRTLLPAAIAVAALAGLESLLSAKVADGMADVPRYNPDRELLGQGLGNLVAALFGGMPSTGAIARTAVNVRAGARSRVAAMVHALVLLGVVLCASRLVATIPLSALGAVLMVTAVRMVEPHNVRAVLRATKGDAAVLALTATATVAFDLITAVVLGIAVAGVLALRQVASTASISSERVTAELDSVTSESLLHEGIATYRLDGALFFGAAQRFLTELTNVADVKIAILRLPDLQVLDATGARVLAETIGELEDRGVTVLVKGPRPAHLRTLQAVGALDRLAHENHLFQRLDDAIAHAHAHLGDTTTPSCPSVRTPG
jgi:SulP family sulfate permease